MSTLAQLLPVGSSSIAGEAIQTASGRDIHAYLGIGKDFSTWVKAQIARARLVENRDYVSSPSRGSSGQATIEYYFTLDAGKQIAMMSETEKGVEVREYFLECERRALGRVPTAKPGRRVASRLLTDVRAIDLIGDIIAKVPGARADVVAAIKLRMIEERTGLPVTQFQSALPAESIEKAVKLNPTAIGKRLAPKMPPAEVNKTLIRLGLQRKTEKGHVLTEAGTAYGESRPYQAENLHVGDQINWYESVVAVVQNAIETPAPSQGQLLGFSETPSEKANNQPTPGSAA